MRDDNTLALTKECFLLEDCLRHDEARTRLAAILAEESLDKLHALREAAFRHYVFNRLFVLQLNGECIGSSDFKQALAHQRQWNEIESAIEKRFGRDALDDSAFARLENDLAKVMLAVESFSKFFATVASKDPETDVRSYLQQHPEHRQGLKDWLDRDIWGQL